MRPLMRQQSRWGEPMPGENDTAGETGWWDEAAETAEQAWDKAAGTAEQAWGATAEAAEQAWNTAAQTVEQTWDAAAQYATGDYDGYGGYGPKDEKSPWGEIGEEAAGSSRSPRGRPCHRGGAARARGCAAGHRVHRVLEHLRSRHRRGSLGRGGGASPRRAPRVPDRAGAAGNGHADPLRRGVRRRPRRRVLVRSHALQLGRCHCRHRGSQERVAQPRGRRRRHRRADRGGLLRRRLRR